MDGQILDNAQLESAVEEFVQDRQKDKYAKVMEILEKSVVLVPSMPPQGLDEETKALMRGGQTVELPREAKIIPCLLTKDTGEHAFPIFTSFAHIPQDKRSPVVLAMPFHTCLSMVMSNQDNVEFMVLNPFTNNIVLPKTILEVAVKRRDAVKREETVKVTKKELHQMVHNNVSLYMLPTYLFEHKEEGLKQLQHEEGSFMMQLYRSSFSKGDKMPPVASADDFSVLTLNVTEHMQITRVDMPNGTEKQGMCYRVYIVWMRETQKLRYYTLEKTEQGNYFGEITSDGKHELVTPAPDNGAEIEAVMNMVTGM